MYITNKRRDSKYGEPDLAASKEAGMQDKTEYENKVRLRSSSVLQSLNMIPNFPQDFRYVL
jgi:hypothetical protein